MFYALPACHLSNRGLIMKNYGFEILSALYCAAMLATAFLMMTM
jgi:hypothetical protein